MQFITDFADQALILPLVAAVALALLLQGWRRGAVVWLVAVGATFAVMLGLKLVFLACPARLGALNIDTPSGHVAAVAIAVGGLATLLGSQRAMAIAAAAGVVIGASRLALGLHSLAEVVLGLLVGLSGVWALRRLAGSSPPTLNVPQIILVAVVVALVFHGLHLPAEPRIRGLAFRVAHMLSVCQSDEVRL
jgi:membrane-associated phospholipid phosphatase